MGEGVADVRRHAVAVVRIAFGDDCRAARAVAFVGDFVEADAACRADAFGDGSLDIFLRHVVLLRLGEGELQAHITDRVSAAHAGRDGDLLGDLRGDLRADRVGLTFFPLDVFPFGMSGHINPPFPFPTMLRRAGGRG